MTAPHRVVILGGGFAGVRVARRLAKAAKRERLAVTLVNRDGTHLYAPGMYQLAGAVTDAARRRAMDRSMALPLRRILAGLPVALIEAAVTGIDCAEKQVSLADGRSVPYDMLVIALGSEACDYGIPGIKEHALPLKSLKDADNVNRVIAALMRGRATPVRITVGGGGPTGVELSAMLAESLAAWQAGVRLTLVEAAPSLLGGFALDVQQYVAEQLGKRGVKVVTGVGVKEARREAVTLADGTVIEHDVFVWTGGTQAPALFATLPFVLDKGRIAPEAMLTCVPQGGGGQTDVYAVGDAACFHYGESHAPWTVNAALAEADHVAKNILLRLQGYKEQPFRLPHQDFVIPLGTTGGIAEWMHIQWKGKAVQWLNWLAEARYLIRMLSLAETLRILRRRFRGL